MRYILGQAYRIIETINKYKCSEKMPLHEKSHKAFDFIILTLSLIIFSIVVPIEMYSLRLMLSKNKLALTQR